jgi:hypothetical protein
MLLHGRLDSSRSTSKPTTAVLASKLQNYNHFTILATFLKRKVEASCVGAKNLEDCHYGSHRPLSSFLHCIRITQGE